MSEFVKPPIKISLARRAMTVGLAVTTLGGVAVMESGCAGWAKPRQSYISETGADVINPFTGEVRDSKPPSEAYDRIFQRLNPNAPPGKRGVLVGTDTGGDLYGGSYRYYGVDYRPGDPVKTVKIESDERVIEDAPVPEHLQPKPEQRQPIPVAARETPKTYKKDPQTLLTETTTTTESAEGFRVGGMGTTGTAQGAVENFSYGFGYGIGELPNTLLTWGLGGFFPQIKINNSNEQAQGQDQQLDNKIDDRDNTQIDNRDFTNIDDRDNTQIDNRRRGNKKKKDHKDHRERKEHTVFKRPT